MVGLCLAQHQDEYRNDWKNIVCKYRVFADMALSHNAFVWDDVCCFQDAATNFMDPYNKITGRGGMANYWHYVHNGHLAYMLEERDSLYQFSQQGWEAMNGRLKRTFNHKT